MEPKIETIISLAKTIEDKNKEIEELMVELENTKMLLELYKASANKYAREKVLGN